MPPRAGECEQRREFISEGTNTLSLLVDVAGRWNIIINLRWNWQRLNGCGMLIRMMCAKKWWHWVRNFLNTDLNFCSFFQICASFLWCWFDKVILTFRSVRQCVFGMNELINCVASLSISHPLCMRVINISLPPTSFSLSVSHLCFIPFLCSTSFLILSL